MSTFFILNNVVIYNTVTMDVKMSIQKLLRAPILKTQQRIGIIINLLSVILIVKLHNPSLLLLGCVLGWFLSVIGANLVAHRWVTHRHFRVKSRFLQHLLLTIYNLNGIGSIIIYASQHILHHKYSGDINNDPHEPTRNGFFLTHFRFYGSRNFKISLKYFRILYNDPTIHFYHKYYWLPIIAWISIILMLFPISYVYYFFIIPLFLTFHLSQAQVTVTHLPIVGSYQNYVDTLQAKTSYNNWIMKPFLLGEEMHNNHHRYPGRANQGKDNSIKEYDILYHLIIKRFFSKK